MSEPVSSNISKKAYSDPPHDFVPKPRISQHNIMAIPFSPVVGLYSSGVTSANADEVNHGLGAFFIN
jgi:hypothetical protein